VEREGHPERLRDVGRGADVVEVGVRREDEADLRAALPHGREDARRLVARSTTTASRESRSTTRRQFCSNGETTSVVRRRGTRERTPAAASAPADAGREPPRPRSSVPAARPTLPVPPGNEA